MYTSFRSAQAITGFLCGKLFLRVFTSSPHPPDTLCDPNIIRLKFIESNHDQYSCNIEQPVRGFSNGRVLLRREVICDAISIQSSAVIAEKEPRYSLEAHMGMHDHHKHKSGVHGGVK